MKTIKNSGFTLIELMITMAFIAIIIAIALPGVSNTLMRYNVSNDMRTVLADINMTKANAMRTCKNTSIQFIPPAVLGQRFTYVVFIDNNADGIFNGNDQRLKLGSLHSGITLVMAFNNLFNGGNSVMFNNLGLPWGFNGATSVQYNGTLTATATARDGSTITRQITVSTGGNVTIN